jgi:peptidyl-prolyl cis-trans isomerase SurA
MKKLTVFFLLIASIFVATIANAKLAELDEIAAVVNNQTISLSQLNDKIATIKKQLTAQKIALPPDNVLANQVLQMMINHTLETQTAKRLNITATTEDIQHAISNIAAQQNMNPTQLRAAIAKQGISESDFIKQVKQEIVMQKLLHEMLASQITVTPQEVDAGVKLALKNAGKNNEYHLLHILVPLSDSPSPTQIKTAQAQANDIVAQLKQGASFKDLAAAHSQGSQMFNGGDMGWKTLAELPTIFANKVIAMKKDEVAGPIQTANGFHILKLVGVRGKANKMNKAQLKEQVSQMIFQRKLQEKQEDWLGQLRAGAYIKIFYKPKALPEPSF